MKSFSRVTFFSSRGKPELSGCFLLNKKDKDSLDSLGNGMWYLKNIRFESQIKSITIDRRIYNFPENVSTLLNRIK